MVKYLSLAVLLGGTTLLLADVVRAGDAYLGERAGIAHPVERPEAAQDQPCEAGEACELAMPAPQLAVLHGAALPPLTEVDLVITAPIGPVTSRH